MIIKGQHLWHRGWGSMLTIWGGQSEQLHLVRKHTFRWVDFIFQKKLGSLSRKSPKNPIFLKFNSCVVICIDYERSPLHLLMILAGFGFEFAKNSFPKVCWYTGPVPGEPVSWILGLSRRPKCVNFVAGLMLTLITQAWFQIKSYIFLGCENWYFQLGEFFASHLVKVRYLSMGWVGSNFKWKWINKEGWKLELDDMHNDIQ